MAPLIRKIVVMTEDVVAELGRPVDHVARRAVAAAVIRNPWHGRGYVADLQPEVREVAPLLARELTARLVEALGGAGEVEAFGKAAIVGVDGEAEHGSALIHTPYFGDLLRDAVDGTSIIVFSEQRAAPGAPLTVPLWHKNASATRSHYQTVEVRVGDAPRPGEIVVVAAASSGARPNARIGDRTTDPAVEIIELEAAAP
ncbi:amino acid synthesis family protein [Spirillospora sp. CA-128828]|uniref:amino acid synthesis family protein n=1 Tax=Spirillospora sp. CA-128828 TaxID=3240033 RepID=UPI003D8A09F2